MGRGVQQTTKVIAALIVAVLACVFAAKCSAQECGQIKTFTENGCKKILLPESVFVDFFISKKALDTVHGNLLLIKSKLDSVEIERKIQKQKIEQLQANWADQERTYKEKEAIYQSDQHDCKQTLSNAVKEGETIRFKYDKIKRRQPGLVLGGFTIGLALATALFIAL